MCQGSDTWLGSRAAFVLSALALCACDPSFDTDWRRRAANGDAGGDAGSLDAETPQPDATLVPDASEFDGSVPPLPSINCSAVVRDASLVSCETDCLPACLSRCSDAAAGCADAEVRLLCWQCVEGGVPPTL